MFCCCAAEEPETVAEIPLASVIDEGTSASKMKEQAPASDSPAQMPRAPDVGDFAVTLALSQLKTRQLGIEVDLTDDKGPMIVNIMSGAVQNFNDSNPLQALRRWDRISSANEVSSSAIDIHKTMKTATPQESLLLNITRPRQFEVTVRKPGELGIQLNYKNSSAGIVVTEIVKGGLLEKWSTANPAAAVVPGDRIIAVNDFELKGKEMIDRIKADQELRLTVLHY